MKVVTPLAIHWIEGIHLLAQLKPEDMEVTPGRLALSAIVLLVVCASIAMMVLWGLRRVNNGAFLPQARRRPLHIPLPLTVVALVVVLLMAIPAMVVSLVPGASDDARPIFDEEQSVAIEDDAVDASDSEEEATDETDSAEEQEDEPEKQMTAEEKVEKRSEMLSLLSMNMLFQAGMFALFGVIVFIVQAGRSRKVSSTAAENVSESGVGASGNEAVAEFGGADLWPDLDSDAPGDETVESLPDVVQDEIETLSDDEFIDDGDLQSEETNPYLMGADGSTADASSGSGDDESPSELEPWNLLTELRFAGEVFLVAFLPTMILRIIMVMLLNDASSHPFLEMLSDGANWDIMVLIMLMAVIVAPIAEELLYRVIVLGGLAEAGVVTGGWVAASVLFAMAHGFPDCVALLPLSFVLGYTYLRRRSYRTVVLVHMLFNGFNMALALLALV